MADEKGTEFEEIKHQLVKLKWQSTTTFIGTIILQLLIFVLLMTVVTKKVNDQTASFKFERDTGMYSFFEKKMVTDMEILQEQILELQRRTN